jgi:hypothetical protein
LTSGTELKDATSTGGGSAVEAKANSLSVPNNSLFHASPRPVGNFIVETGNAPENSLRPEVEFFPKERVLYEEIEIYR